MKRPTSRTSESRVFERALGRHLHLWIGRGNVAYQVQARVWRFSFSFTFWKAYSP